MSRLSFCIGALSALGGVAAHAQMLPNPMGFTIGQEQRDWRTVGPDTPAQLTLMRTAECLVRKRDGETTAYLAAAPGSDAEQVAYAGFSGQINDCMPQIDFSAIGNARRAHGTLTMRFENSALRGALAEAKLRRDKTLIQPAALAIGDDGMFAAERFHGQRSADVARSFALGFAGCVMGNNSSAMAGLFATEPGSEDEKSAIVAMAPSFGQCVLEGQQLKLDAPTLRNQLAETVYYSIMGSKDA